MNGLLETYSTDWSTKFSSPMARYINGQVLGHGDYGDEDWSDPDLSEGAARYGRRVLSWDSQGFVDLATYATEDEAREAFAASQPVWEDEDGDEDEDEPNPHAIPGGLLDEIRQAERLIGSE